MAGKKRAVIGRIVGLLVGTGAIVLILMWLMGSFREAPAARPPQDVLPTIAADVATSVVHASSEPLSESAMGTISPVQRVRVGSRLLARISSMRVKKAGERVEKGQVLATLDDQDLQARVREAQAAYDAAVARHDQAMLDLKRVKFLYEKKVESKAAFDAAATDVRTAEAGATRAKQAVEHATAMLDHATVRAPVAGIVIDKHAEEGDLVAPGQVLVTLYDPGRMQLVARVRERLAMRLKEGEDVDVSLDALGIECRGRIDQIVPEAAAASRVFEVKVSGPCPPGILSGMFARLHVPIGSRRVLRVPAEAIERVGQITSVVVVNEDRRALRRFIRTGSRTEAGVEILTGLRDGETILARAGDLPR